MGWTVISPMSDPPCVGLIVGQVDKLVPAGVQNALAPYALHIVQSGGVVQDVWGVRARMTPRDATSSLRAVGGTDPIVFDLETHDAGLTDQLGDGVDVYLSLHQPRHGDAEVIQQHPPIGIRLEVTDVGSVPEEKGHRL